MHPIIEAVGKFISNQMPDRPGFVRGILETAYSAVGVFGRLCHGHSLQQAVNRYNGAISRLIVKGLRGGDRSVLVNVFFPCELLSAFDLIPVFPEGVSVYATNTACGEVFADAAESRNVPESFCGYQKIMIGMVETGIIPKPIMVTNTTMVCDANQVSYRRVADHYGVPHKVVDVPGVATEESVNYVTNQLYEVVAMLEDLTGRRMDEQKFYHAMERSKRVLSKASTYLAQRGKVSIPTTTSSELGTIIGTHCLSPMAATERYYDDLLGVEARAMDRENRVKKEALSESSPDGRAVRLGTGQLSQLSQSATGIDGLDGSADANQTIIPDVLQLPRKPRIFWMHTLPNWQDSMRAIFDHAHQAELVGSDLAYDYLGEMDLSHPMESLARRLIDNTSNGEGIRRIRETLKGAKMAAADAIIVFCHWGCKQTLGLSSLAKEVFEAHGFPTLLLDGDGCDRRNVSDGQMVTRVGAFLEQVRNSMAANPT